jgi:hypothetical protein
MISELRQRLEQGQRDLKEALDIADYEKVVSLLDERSSDIAALVASIKAHPEHKPWARTFLTHDKELTVRIAEAMDNYRLELEQSSSARQVHRAYLSEGTRS